MKLLQYIKTTALNKFLLDVHKSKPGAFYIICLIIILQLGTNVIKSSLFPFFIYSMYSEPQYDIPSTTSRYVFYADDSLVPIRNEHTRGKISEPIERYKKLLLNGGENQVVNKRLHYLSYILPASVVSRLKFALYKKSIDLAAFNEWYKQYFNQYVHLKFSKLSVYECEYSLSDLANPLKMTPIITFHE